MSPMHEFLWFWKPACKRTGVSKLLAGVVVGESAQSQAVRLGREFLLACALDPWEADDVLGEIALVTTTDDGKDAWRRQPEPVHLHGQGGNSGLQPQNARGALRADGRLAPPLLVYEFAAQLSVGCACQQDRGLSCGWSGAASAAGLEGAATVRFVEQAESK